MVKLGPFAAAHREARVAEAQHMRDQNSRVRAAVEASKRADQAIKQAQSAVESMANIPLWMMDEEQKQVRRLYVEAQQALADLQNADLEVTYFEIDTLLIDAIRTQRPVDIDKLKSVDPAPPKFMPGALAKSTPTPAEKKLPPKPTLTERAAPTGLSSAFGGKKRYEAALEADRIAHQKAMDEWEDACRQIADANRSEQRRYEQREARRLKDLVKAEEAHAQACRQRSDDVIARNKRIDKFRNDISFDLPDALHEYMHMVVGNSVYPPSFQVDFEGNLGLETRELTIKASIPGPADVPNIKTYRYVKARDEIDATALPIRAYKERYELAVWQVGLRVLHDAFKADYLKKIESIALTVAVNRASPSTGRPESVPLVIVAADRKSVTGLRLESVEPRAALQHLGAALSKSPFDLTPADGSGIVRVVSR